MRNAEKIRKEKVQKGQILTESDIAVLERGTLTYNTLNRITTKQRELARILRDMGYYVSLVITQWTKDDIFGESDFKRIVDNNIKLRKAFYVYSNTPMDAVAMYRYNEINALERILYDLERMIQYTKSQYRRCGAYNCGEG